MINPHLENNFSGSINVMKSDFLKLNFSEEIKDELGIVLKNLKSNPYEDYTLFHHEVIELIKSGIIPTTFYDACKQIKLERQTKPLYPVLLKNLPTDLDTPVFCSSDPLHDKYRVKKTFVGEGILELFSQLADEPLLTYSAMNNGDFFHDIYPQECYFGTQTQKTDSELYFHNDGNAYGIRPHFINLLGMSQCHGNRIYTTYIDAKNLIKWLPDASIKALKEPFFDSTYIQISESSHINLDTKDKVLHPHVIIHEDDTLYYHHTQTRPLPDAPKEAFIALLDLRDAITKTYKWRINLDMGDLFSFPNQTGLHAREVIEIVDEDARRHRWLIKTYNLLDSKTYDSCRSYFDTNRPGMVSSQRFD